MIRGHRRIDLVARGRRSVAGDPPVCSSAIPGWVRPRHELGAVRAVRAGGLADLADVRADAPHNITRRTCAEVDGVVQPAAAPRFSRTPRRSARRRGIASRWTRRTGIPPAVTEETELFWAAAREGRLVVEGCSSCGAESFPPRGICRSCRGRAMMPVEITGRGVSYTVNCQRWLPERESLRAVIDLLADNLMFETDLPHATSLSPGPASESPSPREVMERTLGGLSEEIIGKVLQHAATKLYTLQPPVRI